MLILFLATIKLRPAVEGDGKCDICIRYFNKYSWGTHYVLTSDEVRGLCFHWTSS